MEPPITVVHSASADLHISFPDQGTTTASSIYDDDFRSVSCMRYNLNLNPKLERHVAKDANRAVKKALRDRDKGIVVKVRPAMQNISRHDSLREYFEFFDKDGSGAIDYKEMTRALPEIGMNKPQERAKVKAHFHFMDKDNSGEIKFDEFVKSTIDAGMPANLADEQYAARFDKEMFTFLGQALRSQLKADYERERRQKRDDPLSEYLQFQRLVRISQAAVMPNEMSKASKKMSVDQAEWVHSELADVFSSNLQMFPSPLMGAARGGLANRKEQKASKAARSSKLRRKRAAICRRAKKKEATATSTAASLTSIVSSGKQHSTNRGPSLTALQRRENKMSHIRDEMRRGTRLPLIQRWPGNNTVPGGHHPGL